MHPPPERELIAEIFRGTRGTVLEGELILGGSSGLFAFATSAPAFTEDLDFLVREELVEAHGSEVIEVLATLGYSRLPETPTFTAAGRPTFDLVGYSPVPGDRLSRPAPLRVMVFGELGTILDDPRTADRYPDGVVALSPAAFCAVKLLTLRVEKGSKDKLQALLVIAERSSDRQFASTLAGILGRFETERQSDALADAQAAFLSLERDPAFRDHGAEGYAAFLEGVAAGYRKLQEILEGHG